MGMAAAAVPEMGEPINVATSLLPSMDGQTLLWSPQAIRWLACLPWEELLGLWCLTSTLDYMYHVILLIFLSSKIFFDF